MKTFNRSGNYVCKDCLQVFVLLQSYLGHRSQHHPKHEHSNLGHVAWNKGKTKESDVRILQYGRTTSKTLKEHYKTVSAQKHTTETKKLISKRRIDFLLKNPDKVPYLINHSSKESYPEKLFREGLTRENLTGWTQSFRISLYEYDFAFLGQKIDVEIDGSTHLQEKVKKIDKKRDEFSRSHGWKVIRFTAKEVKEDLNGCLKRLMNAL